ncbi:c-type cytochrome [Cohaesibacter celericrescens]|uniref:Cytochrome c family protein n=1 Tax=Cohaesibacter celericrescens TaxID=2067669 RepID=A0A2N5XMV0_9HYPH|nr:cytochrome c family protein [Cohaesibacter celericrescens]PLW75814.1 cytochrome c family protein [Cohaesibacter celericrescens]
MNSFELNKAFGAFLMALIFIMVTGMVTSFIFHAETPEKPGYVIEVADASQEAAPEEVVETVDFATLLASADADKGAKVAKKCASCHTFDAGGANKTGPNLHGIVGRAVASIDGFKYSGSMTEFSEGKSWDVETLNSFLTKPKDLVEKTSMGFAGLKKDKDRADLVSYLQSLSN